MHHKLARDLDHVLSHTNHLWEKLRKKRVFITGGTGFVGTWLTESFVRANDRLGLEAEAFLLTRRPEAFRTKAPAAASHRSIRFVEGDILSFAEPPGKFAFIIHAATQNSFPASAEHPVGIFDQEVEGTRRMLEFARRQQAERFLFTSSGAVYGKQPPDVEAIAEEYRGAPATSDLSSSYGQAKRVSEFLCAMYAAQFGFTAVQARMFTFAGPHLPLDINFAIGNFVRDVLAGGPVHIRGDGTAVRSYLYAADMAIWLWTLLLHDKSAGPYNVGSPEAVSISQLANIVVENTRPGTAIQITNVPEPAVAASRYVPCIEKACRDLGLMPLMPLNEQVRRMFEWNLKTTPD
jgi:dTDP-glucose 4,6-dehydratase